MSNITELSTYALSRCDIVNTCGEMHVHAYRDNTKCHVPGVDGVGSINDRS